MADLKTKLHKAEFADVITRALADGFAIRPAYKWVALLASASSAVTLVDRGDRIVTDNHVIARGSVVTVDGVVVAASPVRIETRDSTPAATSAASPSTVGTNTEDVLAMAVFHGHESPTFGMPTSSELFWDKRTMHMNDAVNTAVQRILDAMVADGNEVGVQVAAYLHGEQIVDAWAGLADPTGNRAVAGDTLFNVFSVTKGIAATALHVQAERGLVDYDVPVARYWPEYGANGKETVTVRDALSHRTGTPQMPPNVTPAIMCDWDAMTTGIAALPPLYPLGQPAYQAVSFGWVIGEIVRRTDPQARNFRDFVMQEICEPYGIADLWVGLPDAEEPRVARLVDTLNMQPPPVGSVLEQAMPFQVRLAPDVFEQPQVRRATIAGVGGIFTARSLARFYAILANGGELDGRRLLSAKRVEMACHLREGGTLPDPVFFGMPMPLSEGGYWMYDGKSPLTLAFGSTTAIGAPGAGGSLGWADPRTGLSVAYCHNRMSAFDGASLVGNAIRAALDIA